jgi:hypothetical protein
MHERRPLAHPGHELAGGHVLQQPVQIGIVFAGLSRTIAYLTEISVPRSISRASASTST